MQVVDTFPRPVRVVENVWIPLSDGRQLAARVTPNRDPFPASWNSSRIANGIIPACAMSRSTTISPGTATPRSGWMCVAVGIPTA
jgi:hypothetical protein